jgi:hypothetical protein
MKNNISLASLALLVGVGLSSFNAPLSLSDVANWQFSPFTKVDAVNPVLTPSNKQVFTCPILKKEVKWEEKDVFNPAAVVRDGKVYWYIVPKIKSANLQNFSFRLSYFFRWFTFQKEAKPIFYPENDAQKSRMGRRLRRSSYCGKCSRTIYYDLYFVRRKNCQIDVGYLEGFAQMDKAWIGIQGSKHHNTWSKSGAIVVDKVGDKMIAKKINGKYWMYWAILVYGNVNRLTQLDASRRCERAIGVCVKTKKDILIANWWNQDLMLVYYKRYCSTLY